MREEWCIPPKANAEFVWHMEDVLDVYTRPYDPCYPQVCMDETNKQLLAEERPALPVQPGHAARIDSEYIREGVANLFLFSEPLQAKRWVTVTDHRTRKDWAERIEDLVDIQYPSATKIILVMDNLNTHSPSSLYETFPPDKAKRLADRLEIHYTPKHGSWLNVAEIELSVLAGQCLDRRIPDTAMLIREVAAWQDTRNQVGGRVNWRFTTADARITLKHLYPTILV